MEQTLEEKAQELYPICPGHIDPVLDCCKGCDVDYKTDHFPNNYDCKYYKIFLEKYNTVEMILKEKGEKLDDKLKEEIIIQLFCINLVSTRRKISDEDIIYSVLENIKLSKHHKTDAYLQKRNLHDAKLANQTSISP